MASQRRSAGLVPRSEPRVAGLDSNVKLFLNNAFAPKVPVVSKNLRGVARRASVSDAAQEILNARGRRGSVLQLAGVAAANAIEAADGEDHEDHRPADKINAASVPHTSGLVAAVVSRSADEVTGQFGYLLDHDYLGIMAATGYSRMELFNLFLQFKALACLSASKTGVDRDTFILHTPMLLMEDPAFKGRVFDLLDTDGSGSIEWEEYLQAMNILAHAQQGKPKPKEGEAGGMGGKKPSYFSFSAVVMPEAADYLGATGLQEEEEEGGPGSKAPQEVPLMLQRQAATGGSFRKCKDASSQRALLTEFLFKCYDQSGNGTISQEELYEFLLDSFYINKSTAEARYNECMLDRQRRMEEDRGRILTAEERAAAYIRDTFGREEPFGDMEADTVAIFKDVCRRVFADLDDNGSGSVSLREAVAYILARPDIADVSTIFGRAMLTGPESDLRALAKAQHTEAIRKARVDPVAAEKRRAAVFEALYRGSHVAPQGKGQGGGESPSQAGHSGSPIGSGNGRAGALKHSAATGRSAHFTGSSAGSATGHMMPAPGSASASVSGDAADRGSVVGFAE